MAFLRRPYAMPDPADARTPWARVAGRRYHLHTPGLAYALTTVVLFLGAVNGQNNLLFWMFGLAAGGLIASGLISGSMLMRLDARRDLPAGATAGSPLVVRYTLRNRGRFFPAMALTIEEIPIPQGPPDPRTAPGIAGVAVVPAGAQVTTEAPAGVPLRGVAKFRAFRVWTTFPFGLMKKSVTFEQVSEVPVRPLAAPVPAGRLAGGPAGSGPAARRSSTLGDEFFALREYVPGDSIRRVAWRASARTGSLLTREQEAPSARRVWVVAGAEASREAQDAVASAAAGLAGALARRGDEVGFACGSHTGAPGSTRAGAFLDALARWQGDAARPPTPTRGDTILVVHASGGVAPEPGVAGIDIRTLGVEIAPPAPVQAVRARWWSRAWRAIRGWA